MHIKSKRPPVKNVATQKETSSSGPENRSKIVLLVDASQQTGNLFKFWVYEMTRTRCQLSSFLKEDGPDLDAAFKRCLCNSKR